MDSILLHNSHDFVQLLNTIIQHYKTPYLDLNFLDNNLFERKCSTLHLICKKCEHDITRFGVKN